MFLDYLHATSGETSFASEATYHLHMSDCLGPVGIQRDPSAYHAHVPGARVVHPIASSPRRTSPCPSQASAGTRRTSFPGTPSGARREARCVRVLLRPAGFVAACVPRSLSCGAGQLRGANVLRRELAWPLRARAPDPDPPQRRGGPARPAQRSRPARTRQEATTRRPPPPRANPSRNRSPTVRGRTALRRPSRPSHASRCISNACQSHVQNTLPPSAHGAAGPRGPAPGYSPRRARPTSTFPARRGHVPEARPRSPPQNLTRCPARGVPTASAPTRPRPSRLSCRPVCASGRAPARGARPPNLHCSRARNARRGAARSAHRAAQAHAARRAAQPRRARADAVRARGQPRRPWQSWRLCEA
ncbi:hypothetical protein PsYK624_008570 [Phanerochaete sordida]|uniref:Uncharacterized protein n=1 Tax=Phanerochaete sordida TaxID=48140 RepID=A0A9P3FYA2_9APHY|nr:hypothetical protein PsYK624_008570 [Phanerochaete sordida]